MCLGIPGQILEIRGDDELDRVGMVEFGGIRKEISMAYTPEAEIGDYVIVHAGFALSIVDEDEAKRIFETLEELEEAAQAMESGNP